MNDLQGLLAPYQAGGGEDDWRLAMRLFGLGLLGTRKNETMDRIGHAGLLAMNGVGQANAARQEQALRNMQMAQLAMGLREKQKQSEASDAYANAIANLPSLPSPMQAAMSRAPSLSPTNENVANVQANAAAPSQFDAMMARAAQYEELAKQQQNRPAAVKLMETAQKIREDALKFRNKNTGTKVAMVGGKPVFMQESDYGAPSAVQGFEPPPETAVMDNGGYNLIYDKLRTAPGSEFAKTMSQAQIEQNKIAQGNLAVAQGHLGLAREANARASANEGKPQIVTGPNGEMFAVDPRSATGRAITDNATGQPLNKGEKALTESQSKATAFANQMSNASSTIADLERKGFSGKNSWQQARIALAGTSGIPFVPGSAAVPRAMAGDAAQTYNQAELQWSEAALRFMTGAAAPEQEVIRNAATYFPRPGDDDAVIKRKKEARENMERSVRMAAGHGVKQLPDIPSSAVEAELRRRGLLK